MVNDLLASKNFVKLTQDHSSNKKKYHSYRNACTVFLSRLQLVLDLVYSSLMCMFLSPYLWAAL